MNKLISFFGLVVLLVAISGCGGEAIPELVEFEGTVLINGNPVPEVMVRFLPDPEKDNLGRNSTGVTDENGKFVLKYGGDSEKLGAAVGWHRICLIDIMAENSRDEPIPHRFSMDLTEAASTPLSHEVKAKESFELDISQWAQ